MLGSIYRICKVEGILFTGSRFSSVDLQPNHVLECCCRARRTRMKGKRRDTKLARDVQRDEQDAMTACEWHCRVTMKRYRLPLLHVHTHVHALGALAHANSTHAYTTTDTLENADTPRQKCKDHVHLDALVLGEEVVNNARRVIPVPMQCTHGKMHSKTRSHSQ